MEKAKCEIIHPIMVNEKWITKESSDEEKTIDFDLALTEDKNGNVLIESVDGKPYVWAACCDHVDDENHVH